ncbi:MAG: glycosyltransferase [Patescibacteria group bacterium]|nr:glycosyltransferase [Patescibacteria group bacterium]
MAKKKILYLTSSAGGGHKAAMAAIMEAIDRNFLGKYLQESVNLLSLMTPKVEEAIVKSYMNIVGVSPATYKAFFELSNNKKATANFDKLVYPVFKKKIADFFKKPPTIIVSTFPFMTYSFKKYIEEQGLSIPFVTQLTDTGEVHSAWLSEHSDYFISPSSETSFWLTERGVPKEKVKTLGFPLRGSFREKYSREKTLKSLGIKGARQVVLYFNSGWNTEKAEKRLKVLDDALTDTAIIITCGKDEKLKEKINSFDYQNQVIALGFIDNVPEIFNAADIVITKAGGASTAEVIGAKKPAIIMDVVPGQEEPNAHFIEKMGFGYIEKDAESLAERLKYIFESDDLSRMEENLKAYHLNDESEDQIAKFVDSLS